MLGILILAAGSSSRMGTPKQLLKLQGKSLLKRAIETVLSIQKLPNLVVLGAFADQIQGELDDYDIPFIINQDWSQGMGTSLRAGVQELHNQYSTLEAVLVMLCDQPFVSERLLKQIITTYQEKQAKVVASVYNDILGVPALFDQSLFEELLNTSPEVGARKILEKYDAIAEKVPFPEGKLDVDTPEDYQKLLEHFSDKSI